MLLFIRNLATKHKAAELINWQSISFYDALFDRTYCFECISVPNLSNRLLFTRNSTREMNEMSNSQFSLSKHTFHLEKCNILLIELPSEHCKKKITHHRVRVYWVQKLSLDWRIFIRFQFFFPNVPLWIIRIYLKKCVYEIENEISGLKEANACEGVWRVSQTIDTTCETSHKKRREKKLHQSDTSEIGVMRLHYLGYILTSDFLTLPTVFF